MHSDILSMPRELPDCGGAAIWIHGTLNLRDSSPSLWNPSPMEFVAWDAQSGNAENSNNLAVNGTQGYIGTLVMPRTRD